MQAATTPMNRGGVQAAIKAAINDCGMRHRSSDHSLRHGCATHLLELREEYSERLLPSHEKAFAAMAKCRTGNSRVTRSTTDMRSLRWLMQGKVYRSRCPFDFHVAHQ